MVKKEITWHDIGIWNLSCLISCQHAENGREILNLLFLLNKVIVLQFCKKKICKQLNTFSVILKIY